MGGTLADVADKWELGMAELINDPKGAFGESTF